MTRTPSPNHGPLVAFATRAVNDEAAPRVPADEKASGHAHMLGAMIRELVRSEVRAELARAIAGTAPPPAYLSAAEYAMARSISISTVRNAIRSGRLPAIKIGAAIRVRADVEIGEPVVVRSSRRPVSPASRGAEIFEARRKRASGRTEAKQAA